MTVSVPSGDFLFFNASAGVLPFRCSVSVPSGDFLFFNTNIAIMFTMVIKFPSPPGTSYFLIGISEWVKVDDNCSVPSGDFLFFNCTCKVWA